MEVHDLSLGPHGVHGPVGQPRERPEPGGRPQPNIGPELISQADEGNIRLTERPTVRNKAWPWLISGAEIRDFGRN